MIIIPALVLIWCVQFILIFGMMAGDWKRQFYNVEDRSTWGFILLWSGAMSLFPLVGLLVSLCISGFAEGGLYYPWSKN